MPTFHYKALAANGQSRTGSLIADDTRLAARELSKMGLTPVLVSADKPGSGGFSLDLRQMFERKSRHVLHFTDEIATLLNAGVTLERALSITVELTEQPRFRALIQEILRTLRGGKPFAEALAAHPEYFSELYVSMVRAGEVSGALAKIMDRLAEFERSRNDLRNYIVSSMTYPALLVLVGLGSVFVILRYVVPGFAEAFESSNIPMPTPMAILMGVSDAVRILALPVAALIVVLTVAGRQWLRSDEGKLRWSEWQLKIPMLGAALQKAETSRFARAMSTLVENSVPLVQSIRITQGILGNRVLSSALDTVAAGVKRGEGVARPFIRTGQFPALAGHLLTVGEETGHLDRMFSRMADIFDKDTREAVKRFTALFEPIVILFMGVIVGAMILSILLAITSVQTSGL